MAAGQHGRQRRRRRHARGRSGGLSGDADRLVFSVLRSLADVILVGAGTARAEQYRPVREREVWAALRRGRAADPADRGGHQEA